MREKETGYLVSLYLPLISILQVLPGPAPHFLVEAPGLHVLAVARPVHSPLLHGYEVVCPRGEQHGVEGQTVSVVLHTAQGEEHSRPQGLVIQPGGVLVDGDLGVEQDGHPLRYPGGGGPGTGGHILVH